MERDETVDVSRGWSLWSVLTSNVVTAVVTVALVLSSSPLHSSDSRSSSLIATVLAIPALSERSVSSPSASASTSTSGGTACASASDAVRFNVCSSAVAYPVPLPDVLQRRYCFHTNIATHPYRPPRRYTPNDIAASLLTVDAYKLSRREAVLRTWMTPLRTPFAHFGVGVSRPGDLLQPILHIPHTDDSFLSNLNKSFIALRELYRRYPDKAWYMQTSDDAWMDFDTLLLRLEPFNASDVLYIGSGLRHERWCPNAPSPMSHVNGGTGFVLSNGFMRRYANEIEPWMVHVWLAPEVRDIEVTKYGDVMVGCFMYHHGIPLTNITGAHGEVPDAGQDGGESYPREDDQWWGWHHINEHEMIDVHLLFSLQRVDQLQAHGQWSELALWARRLAWEQAHTNHRALWQLNNIKQDPTLLQDAYRTQRIDYSNGNAIVEGR